MHSRDDVDSSRRQALKTGGGLGMLGLFTMLGLLPAAAFAGIDRKAFETKSLNEALSSH